MPTSANRAATLCSAIYPASDLRRSANAKALSIYANLPPFAGGGYMLSHAMSQSGDSEPLKKLSPIKVRTCSDKK